MLNILYIIDRMAEGGTEKQLAGLISHLDRQRFRPHLCTLYRSTALLETLPVPKLELGLRRFSHPLTLARLSRLGRYLGAQRIDLVQTFFQDSTLAGAWLRCRNRFTLIGSFRDMGFWRTARSGLKMRLSYPFYDGFIANSAAVKNHFVATDRIDPGKVEVIYNGWQAEDRSGETPADLPAAGPVVGIVGNFNRAVKRGRDFIETAALVRKVIPDCRFLVVGGGAGGALPHDLIELSRRLGLGDAIQFTGLVEDAIPYIRRFSVGVLTSESEGFCNALIEYMGCGVPIAATAAGGNPELVDDGVNGYLVPVGDCRALAARIVRLLEDRDLAGRMSAANRARIAGSFSLERMVAAHEDYYRAMAQGASS